ncbi:hypothetical protein PLESTM_000329900 [Pleodorina starrii]|nr:hypothetical protein PLESTM_000329900 [Pleodorina starrii]
MSPRSTTPEESPLMANANAAAAPPQQLLGGAQHPDNEPDDRPALMPHPAYRGVSQCYRSERQTAELAAEAYDVVMLAVHGERIRTNLPLSHYEELLPHLGDLNVEKIVPALKWTQTVGMVRGATYRQRTAATSTLS